MKIINQIKMFFLLLIIFSYSFAQRTPLSVNIDMSAFKMQNNQAYLEFYYGFIPAKVTLTNINDTLDGAIIFVYQIYDAKTDTLLFRNTLAYKIAITDSAMLYGYSVGKSAIALNNGEYKIAIKSIDKNNINRQDSVVKNIKINFTDDKPVISDLDVCSSVQQSDDKKSIFYKNSHEVIPNPSLTFGGSNSPTVFYYAELYNLVPNSQYSTSLKIIDGKNNTIKQKDQKNKYTTPNVVSVNSIIINTLVSGKYKLALVLSDSTGKELARSEKNIFISNSNVTSSSVDVNPKIAELAGLTDDELKEEFETVGYIASSEDKKMFRRTNSIEARKNFLANFWANVENGKYEVVGITRSIYLDRVKIANERYKKYKKKGWKTDQGRIYLLYGEPNKIERSPYQTDTKPYEVWQYFNIENSVIFVFADRSGYGEYRLVHSTKRGEIYNQYWYDSLNQGYQMEESSSGSSESSDENP